MKRTQGPWHYSVGAAPHYQGQVSDEQTGATVAVTYGDEGGNNARLIAAAPDLLAALERVLPHVGIGYAAFQKHEMLEQAKGAIAKARGDFYSDAGAVCTLKQAAKEAAAQ